MDGHYIFLYKYIWQCPRWALAVTVGIIISKNTYGSFRRRIGPRIRM